VSATIVAVLLATFSPPEQLDSTEEIVVTGERVERTLHDTASSAIVIGSDEIEALAAPDRLDQLLALVPNVELGSGGEGPTVRGQDTTGVLNALPAFLGGTRPRLTLQIDGRAASFNEFVFGVAPIWDVERIEVFRTPQTTTQGRNSIAGAIFIETADPQFDWHMSERIIVGQSDIRQGSAMVTGPVIADQFAFRFAGDIRRSDTSSTRADLIDGADPNRDNYALARFKLLARPAALPGLRIDLTYSHLDTKAPQVEIIREPFEDRHDPFPGYGVFATNVDSLTAVVDKAASSTLDAKATFSFGDSFIQRFAIDGLGQSRTDVRDFSAEGLVNWNPSSSLGLTAGLHRLVQHLEQSIDVSLLFGTAEFDDRQHSLGLFGEADWTVIPKLTLTGGLRYQRDRQHRQGLIKRPAVDFPLDFDKSFGAWLPKLSLAYDIDDRIRAGVLIQRAYNPGGLTMDPTTGALDEFGAETLWDFEVFARTRLDDGRLRLSANFFYNWIRDAQRVQSTVISVPGLPDIFQSEIGNAPRAHSYGLELEGDWRLSRAFNVQAGIGLLRTRIDETTDASDPILGQQFARAPHFSATAAILWHLTEQLQLSAQLSHNSGYYSDDANSLALRIDGATVVDARAEWRAGPVTVFGYARNLFDNFYLTQLYDPQAGSAGDPRELGIGIEASF
jgi:outer membrane receptor protein involved in Fe transport